MITNAVTRGDFIMRHSKKYHFLELLGFLAIAGIMCFFLFKASLILGVFYLLSLVLAFITGLRIANVLHCFNHSSPRYR